MLFGATGLAIFGVLGLLIGSFLNVVIHRLPIMLEAQWKAECAEQSGQPVPEAEAFNLMQPRSRCPHCGHAITWYENIPVLSYLALRGKCSACQTGISARYPLVELSTGLMFVVAGSHYGLTALGLAWSLFAATLIALFFIDFDTQLLPDDLNYPLLWLGLAVSAMGWTVPLSSAVWGAIAGYLCLWLVYHGFRLLTGKEGMGYGDFKLLAALGAWFGVEYLVVIILASSLVGSIIGLTLLLVGRLANKDIPIPFGPFLAGAGLLCLGFGPGQLEKIVPMAFPMLQWAR